MKAYFYDNGTNTRPRWSKNWGDIIGPTIIKHFSKSQKIEATDKKVGGKLVSIGSVMAAARPNDLIWGTGIIRDKEYLPHLRQVKFFGVRGPKTRQHLLDLGHQVPEIYGDPGLLYPMIYNPEIEVTHEWGVIPHYVDESDESIKALKDQGVKVIDICAGEKEFIDQLKSVRKVLSSSLHGLIAADAYGIPNARINITGRIFGGDCKYEDYALAVNRKTFKGHQIDEYVTLEEINKFELNTSISWDAKPLLDNAPWNHEEYKHLFY